MQSEMSLRALLAGVPMNTLCVADEDFELKAAADGDASTVKRNDIRERWNIVMIIYKEVGWIQRVV
jgi:hypothetical protein